MAESQDRFGRQLDLVPTGQLASVAVTVVGVGAIGRHVALQVAALGVRRLKLVDFDTIESTNITTQGYLASDLGLAKVAATARAIRQIDSAICVDVVEDRFRPAQGLGDAVFCCVDSIVSRAAIWRGGAQRSSFWCDGRMLGEAMRILSVASRDAQAYYATTLYDSAEVVAGPCTAQGTIYSASIAAGLMVHQFCRWLRGLPLERDLVLNLLASELVTEGNFQAGN